MKTICFYISFLLIFAISCSRGNKNLQRTSGSETNRDIITDDSLLTLVEYRTFQYFWDGAEPSSGMARERFHVDGVYPENDMNVITTGGSGFGVMAILVGIERGFITRAEAYSRFCNIIEFLKKSDRFHGAWAHWIYGETKGGEDVLYWHWSPDYGWDMNFAVKGYNECLILYILAASSPTYPVPASVYHLGWAGAGAINTYSEKYGYILTLKHNGAEEYGGPLFWAHYSYLGLDPRYLKDRYAEYWQQNKNQTLINWKWCAQNPDNYAGYSKDCWGLTASYSMKGYSAHCPGKNNDLGVISPTAALSSFPYTPDQSMDAMKHFYYILGNKIWGEYGFYDAFSEQNNWFPQRYLAIDQGPAIIMIENYRTGLLWNLFMSCVEIQKGLNVLGFTTGKY